MEISDLIKISQEIQDSTIENKEEYYAKKYPELKEKYPVFFTMSCSKNIDTRMFNYIIDMAKKVKEDKIKETDATIEVGQKLFDKYINSKLEKN